MLTINHKRQKPYQRGAQFAILQIDDHDLREIGMKRFLGVLLVLAILLTPAAALADYDYDSIPTPNIIVVDGDDPSVVFFERDADQKVYPASTTKIMTTIARWKTAISTMSSWSAKRSSARPSSLPSIPRLWASSPAKR
jgi:D-alanyl-D-alanine carboxypeptidase